MRVVNACSFRFSSTLCKDRRKNRSGTLAAGLTFQFRDSAFLDAALSVANKRLGPVLAQLMPPAVGLGSTSQPRATSARENQF
jgi:hypothetical protein